MKYSIFAPFLLATALHTGCAPPPSYYGTNAAPVVDRSTILRREQAKPDITAMQQQPASGVEVTPLEPQGQIEPQIREEPLEPVPSEPVATAGPEQTPAPTSAAPQDNQAVVALLDSAADYVGNGDLDKAAASLERALRIEPRNAGIWHDLGQIRLHQREYNQAEAMFSKSNALAGSNNSLKARNWRMIAAARRAGGDAGGADAAQAQAVSLEN